MVVAALNLVETVYTELKRKLQFSEFTIHDRLVDTEIAGQYGVSRMPAREALLRLVAEGYLVGSTRGFILKQLSLEDIRDLFEVRRQLEPRAAACAARDMTAEHITALETAMVQIRLGHRTSDLARLARANVEFRNIWISAIANKHMAATIARFIDYFQSVRMDTFNDLRVRSAYMDGLEGIYEAFVARDPLAASDCMTVYMLAAEKAFLTAREKQIDQEAEASARPARKNKRSGVAA